MTPLARSRAAAARPSTPAGAGRSGPFRLAFRAGLARVAALAVAGALAFGLPPGAAAQGSSSAFDGGITGTALTLRQLDGVKRVLMIGAHPDDEDTALLTSLARGMGAEAAYLSLTRGDGGQNLIGPELFEGLGVVRTGELMAARALDGGRQFFTRAFDYGFSKSADEALEKWPREELLRDVVWVVRSFRPQVIVSIFAGTPADGHGQHQAAGLIAREAFAAAADPERFPEQFALGVEPWQPAKLYRRMRGSAEGPVVRIETGEWDPLLGRSWFQVAMDSRSQHRSQDMGVGQPFGSRTSDLTLIASAPGLDAAAATDLFGGIDTTLVGRADNDAARTALVRYRTALREADDRLLALAPSAATPALGRALVALDEALAATADDAPSAAGLRADLTRRRVQVVDALLGAAGVQLRAVTSDDLVVPGETVEVTVESWNTGAFPLADFRVALDLPPGWQATPIAPERHAPAPAGAAASPPAASTQVGATGSGVLAPGELRRDHFRVVVPPDADVSRLYFRAEPRNGELYRWPDDPTLWGRPFAPPPVAARIAATIAVPEVGSVAFATERDARFIGVDKAVGEFTQPLLVVPALSVATRPAVTVWPTGLTETREITVDLRAEAVGGLQGSLRLEVPAGWRVEPAAVPFVFTGPAESRAVVFRVTPDGAEVGEHRFRAVATVDGGGVIDGGASEGGGGSAGASTAGGSTTPASTTAPRVYDEGYTLIEYPHIERTAFFDPAETRVTVVPVQVAEGLRVGYIMGSGDDGALALRQMGVNVEVLTPEQVQAGDYSAWNTLVLGVRVYETRPDVAAVNDRILDFARSGGTVVVQYNKYEYPAGGFAPYEIAMQGPWGGAPRVTDEGSPVAFIDPESPLIRGPNPLTLADFDGWVQERGLYFPGSWDPAFRPQLELTDPGEEPTRGSLLVAPLGEGLYIYTGISFFRQFPAGVAGAYRLFANLVSSRAEDWR